MAHNKSAKWKYSIKNLLSPTKAQSCQKLLINWRKMILWAKLAIEASKHIWCKWQRPFMQRLYLCQESWNTEKGKSI